MPANGKERELTEKFNAPMKVWLPMLFHMHKTEFKVAIACSVYPNTVRHWRKKVAGELALDAIRDALTAQSLPAAGSETSE